MKTFYDLGTVFLSFLVGNLDGTSHDDTEKTQTLELVEVFKAQGFLKVVA